MEADRLLMEKSISEEIKREIQSHKNEIEANQDKYVSGDLDLLPELDKTDDLFRRITISQSTRTPSNVLPDAQLLELQTNIVSTSTRKYKPSTLVLNPFEFANKLKSSLGQDTLKMLGMEAKTIIKDVPTHNFIYGAFDVEYVSVDRAKRKSEEKVGKLATPKSINMNQSNQEQDTTLIEAERLYSILKHYLDKSESGLVCFYEFVTDPSSFAHTIENIFHLSLLVKEGHIAIVFDEIGLPYLSNVSARQRSERTHYHQTQSIISLSVDDWQAVIKTFKLTKALVPPRSSR